MNVRRTLAPLLLGLAPALAGCGGEELDFRYRFTVEEPAWYGLGNFTVVHVEPGGEAVEVDWRGAHQLDGSARQPPWQELRLSRGDERYVVTDRGAGNGALIVDGERVELDPGEATLSVRFGEGVGLGAPYDHADARHWYDAF